MNLPTGPRGRLVAAAITLIPLLLLFKLVIGPLMGSYHAQSEEISALQDDITRYRRIIAELPQLKARMARFEQTQPLTPYLLSGSNSALAAASLQRRLQQIAAEHGVRIVSVRVEPPQADGPLEHVAVQARMLTNTLGLRDLLYSLESDTPYMFVDNLSITARPSRRDTASDELEVRMSVFGLRAPDGGTVEAAGG